MNLMKQIIQLLVSMVEAHRQAAELEKAKKEVLIAGDFTELTQLLQRESEVVATISRLEDERIKAVSAYMNKQGAGGTRFTLEELLSVEKNPLIEETVQSLAKELRQLVEEINTLNETNRQLIESSLSYLEYSINMMIPKEPAIGYGPNKGNRHSSLLDAKI